MSTIKSIPIDDDTIMIIAHLQIKKENEQKVLRLLRKITKMPVGESWALKSSEKNDKLEQ